MRKDLLATSSGDRTAKAGESWKPSLAPARAEKRTATSAASDEVRLSKLHEALTFSDVSKRMERLRLDVSNHEYSVPAIEVSRGMVQEHLSAHGF